MGPFEWIKIHSDYFQHGIILFNEGGILLFILGFFIISILSFLAFILAFGAYRRNKIGKKLMMWAMLLFIAAVLVIALSITVDRQSSCSEVSPEGSDDTVSCTYVLPLIGTKFPNM
jgi:magnesium-transporting ATPase (P-type)